MSLHPLFLITRLCIGLAVLLPIMVHAEGVVECENCGNPKQAAITSGIGLTLVADFPGRKLHGFDVEYDRELHRYRALPVPVPDQVQRSFHHLLRLPEASRDRNGLSRAAAKGRGAVIPVHPDDPGGTNGIAFPEASKNLTAYDVAIDAGARTQLEMSLGAAFSGSNGHSPTWNALATTLSSLGMNWLSRIMGVDSATYVITWRDGSKTTLVITPDSVHRAKYHSGESTDAQGNRIPDGAATNPGEAPGYAGMYTFSDEQTFNEWLSAAYIYGVPVDVVEHTYPVQIICRWNGRTLECEVPR